MWAFFNNTCIENIIIQSNFTDKSLILDRSVTGLSNYSEFFNTIKKWLELNVVHQPLKDENIKIFDIVTENQINCYQDLVKYSMQNRPDKTGKNKLYYLKTVIIAENI